MKELNRILNDAKTIVFIDFEGTQFSQEIIAIGAIKVTLDSKNYVKTSFPPFKCFIKARAKVGGIIEDLTGINDQMLQKEGLSFIDGIQKLEKYVGSTTSIKFFTYGSFDMKLLHETSSQNNLIKNFFIDKIYKNHIDFASFMSRYIRSIHNEQLSLQDALKTFNITPKGNAHDPVYDAINLMLLYDGFTKERNIVKKEYENVLLMNPKLPAPLLKAFRKIMNNEIVTKKDIENYIDLEL